MRAVLAQLRVRASSGRLLMSVRPSRAPWSLELCLVVLIPLITLLAGASMIHVASTFGFTAVGEPVVETAKDHGG